MNRRQFVQVAAVLPVWAADGKPMRLGLIVSVGRDPESAIRMVQELGLPTCQVAVDSFEPELAGRLRGALDRYGVEATSVVAGGPGAEVYDFYQGPLTIGLVPRATRAARIARVRQTSDFAKKCGIPAVQTHCGFIPENPNDPLYKEAVDAVRQVAAYCRKNGQSFRCETGQETPVTLLRTIRDVGLDNVGVNFDPANLIMYGKADPVEALDVLGPLVLGVHAKDGLYPVDPKNLGREVPIGQGKVEFPRFIERLKDIGYRGPLTIEREVSGPKQIEDVRAAKAYLEKLVG
jgi:L-ribulose-5-phosphate 3-epimerase